MMELSMTDPLNQEIEEWLINSKLMRKNEILSSLIIVTFS